jgi:outer membrane lipase/esterase
LPFPFPSVPDPAPPKLGYFPGRFTNGPNFADLLSVDLTGGALQTVFPYGFPTPFGQIPFDRPEAPYLNFGYGGAQAIQGDEQVPDLSQQITALAKLPGPADPNAVYLLTFGGNDIRQLVPQKGRIARTAKARAYLNAVSDEIAGQVSRLFGLGARQIVLTGVPDIGLLPTYSGRSNEDARRRAASAYSSQLNALLLADLDSLALSGDQELTFYDFQPLTQAILADPAQFGLSDIRRPCLAVMKPAPDVDCSGFLFFDDVHPTAQVHQLIANDILAGFTTTSVFTAAVPEPETWTMLLVGFILLSVNLRRKNQGDPRRPSFALASHLRS